MSIIKLLSLDGVEITEQGRKYSGSESIAASDVELDLGINKRYIKQNKKISNISFTYLPNSSTKTIDNRAARDYLKTIANKRGKVLVNIKLSPNKETEEYYAYVTNYSENLIRRDLSNQCSYYDLSINFEEA